MGKNNVIEILYEAYYLRGTFPNSKIKINDF